MKNVCLKYTARKTASRRRPSYGVTLVELMVVIVILVLVLYMLTIIYIGIYRRIRTQIKELSFVILIRYL